MDSGGGGGGGDSDSAVPEMMDPLCGVPEILLATDALLSAAVGVSGKFGGGDDVGVLGTADPCRWSIVRPPSRVLDAALCRSVSNCTRHEDRGGASIDETRRRAQHAHRLETARAWGATVKHAGAGPWGNGDGSSLVWIIADLLVSFSATECVRNHSALRRIGLQAVPSRAILYAGACVAGDSYKRAHARPQGRQPS